MSYRSKCAGKRVRAATRKMLKAVRVRRKYGLPDSATDRQVSLAILRHLYPASSLSKWMYATFPIYSTRLVKVV